MPSRCRLAGVLITSVLLGSGVLGHEPGPPGQPVVSVIWIFGDADGRYPSAPFIQAADGNLYGTTELGGSPYFTGAAFKMNLAGSVTLAHAFRGAPTDGRAPMASLIQALDGNFYGTTREGGANSMGTVFKMTVGGTVTILHSFAGGTDGQSPLASLIQASDGNFYGTTVSGGAGLGTVFMITPTGAVTVLHAFGGEADGASPCASLIQTPDGYFYGTTRDGGAAALGTIFSMSPAGVVSVLHAFNGGTDGSLPTASLIRAHDGNFYGTTSTGGDANKGTAFRMTPDGTVTVIHSFAVVAGDGSGPEAALIQASDGNFYGTTRTGGAGGVGAIFEMTSDGSVTVLHSFFFDPVHKSGGWLPKAALLQANDGNLYGTTSQGGSGMITSGVAFRVTLDVAPAITSQPQSQSIPMSRPASLSVAVTGSGLSYQWYTGPSGTTTNPIGGATSSAYAPMLINSTNFWVRVSNAYGSIDSSTATVTVDFTDAILTADSSLIRAAHVTELRSRIDAARVRFRLAAYAWTDVIAANASLIRSQHIVDLRDALSQAYVAAGRPAPTFTDPGLGAGMPIKSIYIAELRAAVLWLE